MERRCQYALRLMGDTNPSKLQKNTIYIFIENNKLYFKAEGMASNGIEISKNDICKEAYENIEATLDYIQSLTYQARFALVKLVKKYGYDLSDFDFSRYCIKKWGCPR